MKNTNAIMEKDNKNVRCLCIKCVKDYLNSDKYNLKRLNPFSNITYSCDKCGRSGRDYIVIEKDFNRKKRCNNE